MADKLTDGPDASLTKQTSEDEQQKSRGSSPPAPQQVIEQFEQVIAGAIGPVRNPVLEKVTEDHITAALELAGEDSKADRRYRMAYTIVLLIAFGLLTFYMVPADTELYKQIVQLLIAAGGGFGAGYGVRYWQG